MPCAVHWLNCPYPGDKDERLPKTAVGDHDHPIKMDDVKVIALEDNMWWRKFCESIEIRTRHPAINLNQGYELPAIYDELLSCDHRSRVHVTSED